MSIANQATFYLFLLLAATGCRQESTETVVHDPTASATSSTSSVASRKVVTGSAETVSTHRSPIDETFMDPSIPELPNRYKLKPVDEASSDPSFVAFRETLKDIVRRKDSKALQAIIDPKIRASFGDDNGIEAFRKMWKLDEPGSPLWEELSEVLRLGGSWKALSGGPKVFWAPYTYSNFPESGPDAFSTLIVIDRNVPLKETPSASSKTLGMVSYDIVDIYSGDRHEADWRKVSILNHFMGYLPSSKVRSPIDYRAGFEKKEGQWKLTIFVAGD